MAYTKRFARRVGNTAAWGFASFLLALGGGGVSGCAGTPPPVVMAVFEEGRDVVRLDRTADTPPYSHPMQLRADDIRIILRGVRVWERRNVIHELVMGEADRKRAFRDDDIATLAPALSKALGQAGPQDRVWFHLSSPTESGDEETTTGWLYVRGPILHLVLTEVRDIHGPQPDISKYDRQMPNIPEIRGPFNVTFEPEEYLVRVVSAGTWFSPEQEEDLQIEFRKALPASTPPGRP